MTDEECAAILRFLDPDDEALVEVVRAQVEEYCVGRIEDDAMRELAIDVLAALKASATQGEPRT